MAIEPGIEVAVAERFLATGKPAAEIAEEFGISEEAVWACADRATNVVSDGADADEAAAGLATDVAQESTVASMSGEGDPASSAAETDHPDPPAWLMEAARQSLANGGTVASVARWYGVPEALLEDGMTAPSVTPNGVDDEVHTEEFCSSVEVDRPVDTEEFDSSVEVDRPVDTHEFDSTLEVPDVPVPAATDQPEMPPARSDSPKAAPSARSPYRPSSGRPTPPAQSSNRIVGTKGGPGHPAMSLRDSLQALRRRLLVLVVGLVLGAVAGWLTAPGAARRPTSFSATHTAFYEPSGGVAYNIQQVALLATSGEVPSRVAARLHLDREQVRAAVSAATTAEVGTISVTARAATADAAVALSDLTVEELAAELSGRARAVYDAEVARLTAKAEAPRNRLNAIPPKDTAAQAAAQTELAAAEQALRQYQNAGPPTSSLRTLEGATASAVRPAGVRAPDSKPVRAGLLGILGLLASLAAAFALDRVDTRIRSKAIAEEVFGAPVVAEIPRLSKASEGQLLARTQASSPFVEAYRGLRTYVALWAPENGHEDGHRVIVVTSPSAGEGKTTTVAHLAAMLAEIGRSVVVVSADLRRPRLHQYFDLPIQPGLVEALNGASGRPVFAGLDQATSVRGVRLIPSGPPVENPAPLFEHAGDLVGATRGLADFVLIDAPPLLVANDAVEMARYADGVLLVARSGDTAIEAAERSAEVLERLAIPVVGTVLVASEAASSASRYYASHYYSEPERGRRRWLPSLARAQAEVTPPDSVQ